MAQAVSAMKLTKQEARISLMVAAGKSNKEIARWLGISDGTVKQHLHSTFRKTGVRNRTISSICAAIAITVPPLTASDCPMWRRTIGVPSN